MLISAIQDYEKANQINPRDSRVHEGHGNAKRMLKLRDYYKILEVSRQGTTREIKEAYRKQARLWHPDKYKGDLSNEEVQKRMSEVNLAYEVLSNPGNFHFIIESREKYDAGEDPNDPRNQSQNQQGGGFPGGFGGFPGGFSHGEQAFHFNF